MPHNAEPSLEPVLLGTLMEGPRHGYELYRELAHDLGRVWQVGLSQLYAHLKQLEAAGQVAAEIEEQPSRPPRKVYRLTPAGREAFLGWLHRPTSHLHHIRLEFLARLYFFRRLALPGLEPLVAAQKALLQCRAEALVQSAGGADDDFLRLVHEFRRGQVEAIIRWLDRCLEAL